MLKAAREGDLEVGVKRITSTLLRLAAPCSRVCGAMGRGKCSCGTGRELRKA